VDRLDKKSI